MNRSSTKFHSLCFFFFNDTATTEIYTLSLHDALPIFSPPEIEKYGPYRNLLLSVKPGITGYWQVRGRQELSYEERVRMDVYYIENWSLGMDINILLRSEEHTSELQSQSNLVCRLLLEK